VLIKFITQFAMHRMNDMTVALWVLSMPVQRIVNTVLLIAAMDASKLSRPAKWVTDRFTGPEMAAQTSNVRWTPVYRQASNSKQQSDIIFFCWKCWTAKIVISSTQKEKTRKASTKTKKELITSIVPETPDSVCYGCPTCSPPGCTIPPAATFVNSVQATKSYTNLDGKVHRLSWFLHVGLVNQPAVTIVALCPPPKKKG
jgi:hypothetical protein